jgi:NAD(P)-dependent dehydrogenase (short-subunit alcohol dehydrogenase family)
MKLSDKVAIITGSAIGIGHAMAEGLAEEGASVVIADLCGAEPAAEAFRTKGVKALGLKVDVSSEEDTNKMADEVLRTLGRIDILVNNAGLFTSLVPGPFEKITVAEWRKVMDVNLMGLFLCSRAVIAAMRQQKFGRIINLSSGVPFKGVPYLLHYVTSKGGVIGFTRALAKEVGSDNILVNAIAPGYTLSDGALQNEAQMKYLREVSIKGRTLARDMHPQDLVGAVKFFAGPESDFITGQTLVVDGGSFFH